MSHQPVIDGLEFARAGSKLRGAWPVAEFQRLRDVLRAEIGTLHFELHGVPEAQGRPALRLQVQGALQLTCQRCLGALEFRLQIDAALRLAESQAEIDAEPLEAEGPESIVAGREMQVRLLVEDEVLLAIPIAPRHDACAGGAARVAGEGQRPFAGLRGLVDRTRH
jgi:uncharacterized protein